MGAYYFFVNETKREYFSIDPVLDQEIKFPFVGDSIGSRAFGFLLWADDIEHSGVAYHELLGAWIGDRAFVASDHGQHFDVFGSQYKNIRQDVVELLMVTSLFYVLQHSGEAWIESLINGQHEELIFTDLMRKTLREEFLLQQRSHPNDFYARILKAT
ncbi:hypothetical protein OAG71_03355 [bacterium]|nr:hypothetical protein [bacterium]